MVHSQPDPLPNPEAGRCGDETRSQRDAARGPGGESLFAVTVGHFSPASEGALILRESLYPAGGNGASRGMDKRVEQTVRNLGGAGSWTSSL